MYLQDYADWKRKGKPEKFKSKNRSIINFWKTEPNKEQILAVNDIINNVRFYFLFGGILIGLIISLVILPRLMI
jgi:hypothetical protein